MIATPPRSRLGAAGERVSRTSADGDIDEEDDAPAESEEVGLDQEAASRLPGERGDADHRAVDAQGAAALLVREGHLDDREHLRAHQRRAEPLDESRDDEQPRPRCKAAERRGEREARHAEHEEPLTPVDVAEPPTGDQRHRVGERIPGDDELHLRETGVQVSLHRRDGDVDDELVEDRHERCGDDHDKREPAPRIPLRCVDR
jgi:hypothetical protein